jgi:hypothetical protein
LAASAIASSESRWATTSRVEIDTSKPYSIWEQVTVPWTLVRTRAGIFHAPHYVLPPLTHCRSW